MKARYLQSFTEYSSIVVVIKNRFLNTRFQDSQYSYSKIRNIRLYFDLTNFILLMCIHFVSEKLVGNRMFLEQKYSLSHIIKPNLSEILSDNFKFVCDYFNLN